MQSTGIAFLMTHRLAMTIVLRGLNTPQNRSNLLGLYKGLITFIELKTIHRWGENGTPVEEIKSAIEKLPVNNHSGYYPWFLQNQWVLHHNQPQHTNPVHKMMLRGWQYAGSSLSATLDKINNAKSKWPKHKQEFFTFCTGLLSDWHPFPELTNRLTFGFFTI